MDGANRWQKLIMIDIPSLVPTIIILLILNSGNIMNIGFEKVYLMQNSMNLPVSEVISTYVYKIGIMSNQISYASAIGLFNTMINFVFLVFVNFISKKQVILVMVGEVELKQRNNDFVFSFLIILICIIIVVVVIYPVYFVFIASVSNPSSVRMGMFG